MSLQNKKIDMEERTMGKLLIGWAEESIVPEKKVSLAGQFFERISECRC